MKFGTKRAEESTEQKSSGGGGKWAKSFKDGETEIRFLEEQDEWTGYWEHYDASIGQKGSYFPCTGDRNSCPGCTSENERTKSASHRYLTNALVGNYVDIWKIPASVSDKIEARAARKDDGSVLQRPYTVYRSGKAPNIEYDVESESTDPIDIARYVTKMKSHEELLERMWTTTFGDASDDPKAKSTVKEAEDKSRYTDPDDDPAVRAARKAEREAAAKKSTVPDNPPSEPQPEKAAPAGEPEVELTEEAVRAMSADELKSLIQQCGLESNAPDTDNAGELADYLIDALS